MDDKTKEAVERVADFCNLADFIAGTPEDDQGDAEFGREAVDLRHRLRTLLSALEEAEREKVRLESEWANCRRQRDNLEAAGADRLRDLESATALLQEAAKVVEELRRAIGDHWAPNDCYATGPVTGDAIRDLVQCPACSAISMYDAFLTRLNPKGTGQ